MSYLNKRLILQSAVAHGCKNSEEVFLAFLFIYFEGLILRIDDSIMQQTISGKRLLECLL